MDDMTHEQKIEALLREIIDTSIEMPDAYVVSKKTYEKLLKHFEYKLKPCPCCGGSGKYNTYKPTIGSAKIGWYVRCVSCEMIRTVAIDIGSTKEQACSSWNKRC